MVLYFCLTDLIRRGYDSRKMQDLGEPIPMPPAPPPVARTDDDLSGENKPLPRIIASNLPKSWGNINLGKFFEQFGAVTDCGLLPGTDKGYVLLSNVGDILKAVRSVPQLPPVEYCKITAIVDDGEGTPPEQIQQPISDIKRPRLDDTSLGDPQPPLRVPDNNNNTSHINDDRLRKQKPQLPLSMHGDMGRKSFHDNLSGNVPPEGQDLVRALSGNGQVANIITAMQEKNREQGMVGQVPHHHHHHHHQHHHRNHHNRHVGGRGGGSVGVGVGGMGDSRQPALARFLTTPVGPTGVPASGPINTNNPTNMDTLKKNLLSNPAIRNALQQMTAAQGSSLLPPTQVVTKPIVGVGGLAQPATNGANILSQLQSAVAGRVQQPQAQPFPTPTPTPQLQPPQGGGVVQQLIQTLASVQGQSQASLTPQPPNRGIPPSLTSPPNQQSSNQLLDLVKNLNSNKQLPPPAAVPGSLPPSQHPSAAPPMQPNTSNLAALLQSPGLLQNQALMKQVTAAIPASSKPVIPLMPTQVSTPSKGMSKQKSDILSKRPEGSDAVYVMMKSSCHEFLAQSVEHELWFVFIVVIQIH